MSFVFVIISLTYFSRPCHAQYLTGPVASSLGGTGRAAVDDGEQALLNPASVVHGSPFTSELIFIDGYADKNEHDNIKSVGFTDNTEELIVSGGYYYALRRRTFENSQTLNENYHQFSLGRFAMDHLAFGVAITYLDTNVVGGSSYKQWDGNLGLHYNPQPDLGFGLVFYNILRRDKGIPTYLQNQDSVFAGVNYLLFNIFRLRFDLGQQLSLNPSEKLHYELGIESKVGEFLVTRIGLNKDELLKRDFYTLGFGFDGPRVKLDYSYSYNPDYSSGAMHGVDLRLPFW